MAKYSYITDKSNDNRPIQVESAVRDGDGKNIVNNYAKQNGNYQTMTVGLAENLTPYSDEAGTEQDIPFALQGTGCGNGETVVDTGSFAQLKEKQGNSVVANELIKNPSFDGTTEWNSNNATISASNHILTVTPSASGSYIIANRFHPVINHKYLLNTRVKLENSSQTIRIRVFGQNDTSVTGNTNWNDVVKIITPTLDVGDIALTLTDITSGGSTYKYYVNWCYLVDLTQWFGSNDNIPAYLLAHPESFFNYYRGSLAYNVGTLTDSNAQYLKCIGRNQWDEETRLGYYNESGVWQDRNDVLSSKNPIPVIGGETYYIKNPNYAYITLWDANGNFIERLQGKINETFTVPINCSYIHFNLPTQYGTTYNNDITISIYYDGESGYDQYYPYEVLSNIDTGNEVLRSAGSVEDYKEPDGTIHRLVGVVDLGTLNYSKTTSGLFQTSDLYGVAKGQTVFNIISNILSPIYTPILSRDITGPQGSNPSPNMVIAISIGGQVLYINNTSYNDATAFKTAMSGVYLYYELATPTTEQGTSFSENVNIHDFGSMEWKRADDDETTFNGVPQGCEIFYPVDYKAFVDTLTNYCDGDVNNLVLQSDLTASESARDTVDAQLKNALGGTLRQLLAISKNIDFLNTDVVDLSTLTWTYASNTGIWSTVLSDMKKVSSDATVGKMISTNYKTISFTDMGTASNTAYISQGWSGSASTYLNVKNGSSTEKPSGLLAYEKA